MLEPLPCRNAQKRFDVSGIPRYRGSQIRFAQQVASRLPKNQHKRREEAGETYISGLLQGSTTGNQIGNDNPKLCRHLWKTSASPGRRRRLDYLLAVVMAVGAVRTLVKLGQIAAKTHGNSLAPRSRLSS